MLREGCGAGRDPSRQTALPGGRRGPADAALRRGAEPRRFRRCADRRTTASGVPRLPGGLSRSGAADDRDDACAGAADGWTSASGFAGATGVARPDPRRRRSRSARGPAMAGVERGCERRSGGPRDTDQTWLRPGRPPAARRCSGRAGPGALACAGDDRTSRARSVVERNRAAKVTLGQELLEGLIAEAVFSSSSARRRRPVSCGSLGKCARPSSMRTRAAPASWLTSSASISPQALGQGGGAGEGLAAPPVFPPLSIRDTTAEPSWPSSAPPTATAKREGLGAWATAKAPAPATGAGPSALPGSFGSAIEKLFWHQSGDRSPLSLLGSHRRLARRAAQG